MNSLYKKLYEAIDVGIYKALVLPDEIADDVSVKFCHKEISNDFIPYGQQVIDLGLSVKWAKYNYGAFPGSKPEDWYGNYYAWGETNVKPNYTEGTYVHSAGAPDMLIKYNTTRKNGTVDKKLSLDPEDDVIKYNVDLLRMPTVDELKELLNNTNIEWAENYNGHYGLNGYVMKSKTNDNYIFMPASGFQIGTEAKATAYTSIWSSTLCAKDPECAECLILTWTYETSPCKRYVGLPVRGVCE